MLRNLIAPFRHGKAGPRESEDGRPLIPGLPDELAVEIDRNGAPVTMEPEEWFVCFVPGLQKQWWHRFTDPRHKHVFAMRRVSEDQWLLFEPWWTRIEVTTLSLDEAVKYLRWGGAGSVLRVKESIPGSGSQARGWANCAVLASLLLGRSYWTWTPHGLYLALSREPGVEHVDVAMFLEEHVADVIRDLPLKAVGTWERYRDEPLQELLRKVGVRLMTMMTSPVAVGVCRFALSETFHFPAAWEVFFERGPNRVIEELITIFRLGQSRGEVSTTRNPESIARHFLSMLRGNLHLEIICGCRSAPSEAEIERRVSSVVDLLMNGVGKRYSPRPCENSSRGTERMEVAGIS